MPPSPTTQRMGELHEEYLADVNGGRRTVASGSQWDDQGDGRNAHDDPYAFCWDGKSTRGQQIAVTLAMIAKVREQAQGERPQIGLRWYANDLLDKVAEDWIAVRAEDWREVLAAARKLATLEAEHGDLGQFLETPVLIVRLDQDADPEALEKFREDLESAVRVGGSLSGSPSAELRAEIEELRGAVAEAEVKAGNANTRWSEAMRTVAARDAEIELLRADLERHQSATAEARTIPGYVPQLPWVVVNSARTANGGLSAIAIRYDAQGAVTRDRVNTLRVERSLVNRPRIILDDTLVPNGDVYIAGVLSHRAWADRPEMELG